jgi:predicted DNA-binding transcriptional regulator AlpA
MQRPTPTRPEEALLLTETEAAKILGFSVRTLQGWRYRGGGPRFVRISRTCVRYRRQDLEAWIEECLRVSTSDDGARRGFGHRMEI